MQGVPPRGSARVPRRNTNAARIGQTRFSDGLSADRTGNRPSSAAE